jgi:hypothetical protein
MTVTALCAAALVYTLAQVLLLAYASHRWVLLARWRAIRRAYGNTGSAAENGPLVTVDDAPRVTVQLPVYNEVCVVERAIDAVAALDHPRACLEIQVLDDSTDPRAVTLAAAAVARHRAAGLDIIHVRRGHRDGFKAGALASGLAGARGAFLAVFDADFVPRPDFLRSVLPAFRDPRVGMVQAGWEHLNRDDGWLTAAQATLLDAHFALEHGTRAGGGLFFNFNGTAGVWRRACIEDAGGWSAATLTEDLDLSYRAQLRGWRFAYAADVGVPAELPRTVGALRSQQHRWALGSIQTARRLLPRVLAAPIPGRVKLEACFHLTSNVAYPLLLVLGLLLAPLLAVPPTGPRWLPWLLQGVVVLAGMVPVALFLAAGRRARGATRGRALRDAALALVLGIGLSLANTRAVLEGLWRDGGTFIRTPKTGNRPVARPLGGARARRGRGELALAGYFAAVAVAAVVAGQLRAVPFLALLVIGFGAVGLAEWSEPAASAGDVN